MSELSESFRRLIAENVIDFPPGSITVSLTSSPIRLTVEDPGPSSEPATYSLDHAAEAVRRLAVGLDVPEEILLTHVGFDPPPRIPTTDWLQSATDEDADAWNEHLVDAVDFDDVFGPDSTHDRLRIPAFTPPKGYRLTEAGPFVYPQGR